MTDPTDLDALRDAVVLAADAYDMARDPHAASAARAVLHDELTALRAAQRPPPVPTEPGAYYLEDGSIGHVHGGDGDALHEVSHDGYTDVSRLTWATEDGQVVEVPTWGEWKATQTPCTCGSGGHPRPCKRHPLRFDAHCRELQDEQKRDEVEDQLRAERDEARATLARVRKVVEDMDDDDDRAVVAWCNELRAALEGGTDGE